MSDTNIVAITKNNIDHATQAIYDAFKNDPFMLWLMGGSGNYEKIGLQLIKTWVRHTSLYGLGFVTQHAAAAVLFKKPGKLKFNFWQVIRSGMLKTPKLLGKDGMNRLMTMDKQWDEKRLALMGKRPHLYCWTLGTAPQDQGKGYGTALMQAGFKCYPTTPCYLETQSESNQSYYEKLGFNELDRFFMEGTDFPIICMCREPKHNH